MKKSIITILLSIIVLSSFAKDGFLAGLKNTDSKKEKLLVVFYKPDCPYCQSMDKIVSNDLLFREKITQNFNVQVFDITSPEGRAMADQFNVHVVPSMVNFNVTDGNFTVIKGFAGTQKLLTLLGLAEPEPHKNIPGIVIPITNNKSNETVPAVCGDGIVEVTEGCDDGNLSPGDGCNASCAVEPGFNCSGSPSVCSTVCGDGVVTAGESCDDGNTTGGDGCNAICAVEPGFNCSGSPSICSSVCGDGVLAAGEGCDDGNTTGGDGCNATCAVEPGFVCTGSPSSCTNNPPVNNECAGAVNLTGTSGTVNGQNETATNSAGIPIPTCQSNINKDVWYQFILASTKNVKLEANGPSVTDPVLVIYSGSCASLTQVACDDDNGPGAYSIIQATLNAGTYYVRVGTYNVTATGTFSLVYNLNLTSICGNNIIEAGEQCDDGNTANGDNCSSTCLIENTATIKGVSVNEDATPAHPSAMLDVKSFDRGVLIPRMNSSQRTAIASPAKGLMVFDNTTNTFWFYNGTVWTEITGGSNGGTGSGLPSASANQTLRSNGTVWLPNSVLQNDGTNVTVTGQLKITGGSPAAGKILTSDASGLASWSQPATATAFAASKIDADIAIPSANAWSKINFGSVQYNSGNAYSGTNSEFTAPVSGLYHFDVKLKFAAYSGTATNFVISLYYRSVANPTGFGYYVQEIIPSSTKPFSGTMSTNFSLNAGDIIDVRVLQIGGTTSVMGINGSGMWTQFSGYRVN